MIVPISPNIHDREYDKFRGQDRKSTRIAVGIESQSEHTLSSLTMSEKFDLILIELRIMNKHFSEITDNEFNDRDVLNDN